MNNLFSSGSFKRYADLKRQPGQTVQLADDDHHRLESGIILNHGGGSGANMDKFFEEVESVKADLQALEQLHRRLHAGNEESKTASIAETARALRSRMDRDVEAALRTARGAKAKLEALERSNAAHRELPGCGPGSSADRTRTSVASGLGTKLAGLMGDFQGLRGRIAGEYRDAVARRYYAVTGRVAEESIIDALIASGESEKVVQKAIERMYQHDEELVIVGLVSEMKERHDAVAEIERSLQLLHQLFLDMSVLVHEQGRKLDDVQSHVARAASFVRRGTDELETAAMYGKKRSRKRTCVGFFIGGAAVVVVVVMALLIIT